MLGEVAVEEARGIETCEFAVKDMPYVSLSLKFELFVDKN